MSTKGFSGHEVAQELGIAPRTKAHLTWVQKQFMEKCRHEPALTIALDAVERARQTTRIDGTTEMAIRELTPYQYVRLVVDFANTKMLTEGCGNWLMRRFGVFSQELQGEVEALEVERPSQAEPSEKTSPVPIGTPIQMTVAEAYATKQAGPFVYYGNFGGEDGYAFSEIELLDAKGYYGLVNYHSSGSKGTLGISGERVIVVTSQPFAESYNGELQAKEPKTVEQELPFKSSYGWTTESKEAPPWQIKSPSNPNEKLVRLHIAQSTYTPKFSDNQMVYVRSIGGIAAIEHVIPAANPAVKFFYIINDLIFTEDELSDPYIDVTPDSIEAKWTDTAVEETAFTFLSVVDNGVRSLVKVEKDDRPMTSSKQEPVSPLDMKLSAKVAEDLAVGYRYTVIDDQGIEHTLSLVDGQYMIFVFAWNDEQQKVTVLDSSKTLYQAMSQIAHYSHWDVLPAGERTTREKRKAFQKPLADAMLAKLEAGATFFTTDDEMGMQYMAHSYTGHHVILESLLDVEEFSPIVVTGNDDHMLYQMRQINLYTAWQELELSVESSRPVTSCDKVYEED